MTKRHFFKAAVVFTNFTEHTNTRIEQASVLVGLSRLKADYQILDPYRPTDLSQFDALIV